jgi:hypothetical protein
MNEKWRPKPSPRNRTGALVFIFVFVLFVLIAGLLFLLNPFPQSAIPDDLLGPPPTSPPGVSVGVATPNPAAPGQHWDLFLPLISS